MSAQIEYSIERALISGDGKQLGVELVADHDPNTRMQVLLSMCLIRDIQLGRNSLVHKPDDIKETV